MRAVPRYSYSMSTSLESEPRGFPSDWAKTEFPSYGPNWDKAIAYGIDVSLLLENLALTPTERLARLQQVVQFHVLLRNARGTT